MPSNTYCGNIEDISLSTSVKEEESGDIGVNEDLASSTNFEDGEQPCGQGNILKNVWDPGRLNVLSSCQEAIGIIDHVQHVEHDGYIKLFVKAEDGYQNLLNKRNEKR